MRILVVHNRHRSTSPSGEDRVVDQEHDVLAAAGHTVRRLERSSDDIAAYPPARRALVPVQMVWSRRSAAQVDAVLAEFAPDVVHVHNLFPLLSPSVLHACQRGRVPCVVTLHNYWQICGGCNLFRTGSPCHDCVGRRLPVPAVRHGCYRESSAATLPHAVSTVAHRRSWRRIPAAYVFLSEAQRRELEPLGLPASRCFVKPNLVLDRTDTGADPGLAGPDRFVAYLGRLTEEKGLRVLMRAWDRYAGAGRPGLRLVVAGAGPLEGEIRAWAASRPSVEVVGLLDRQACDDLVRRATAVVVPSEWAEPFGLVVGEAMAAGVAPVATAHGAFVDLVTDGEDGLLYPPGDAGRLADLLSRIERSPGWLAELGAAARRTYARRLAPPANVAMLEEIYRFAVSHPRWLEDAPAPTGPAGGASAAAEAVSRG